MAVHIEIDTEQFSGNPANLRFLAKRQRAGAVQDASRISIIIVSRTASWSAAALRRFSPEPYQTLSMLTGTAIKETPGALSNRKRPGPTIDLQTKEPPPKIAIETHDLDKPKKGGRVWNRGVAGGGRNHGDCLPAQNRKPDRAGRRKTRHRQSHGCAA